MFWLGCDLVVLIAQRLERGPVKCTVGVFPEVFAGLILGGVKEQTQPLAFNATTLDVMCDISDVT